MGYLLIVYLFHRHYLFGEGANAWFKSNPGAPPQKFGWFLLLSVALILCPMGLSAALAFAFAPQGSETSQIVWFTIVFFVPLYLLSLSLFGTALPASVARTGNFRMSSGIKVTFSTMWRLIMGPVGSQVLLYGLILGFDYLLRDISAYRTTTAQLAVGIIASTLAFLPNLMGVAVLCHMYEKVMASQAARNANAASHP